jgi:hypothetical protein
MGIMPIDLRLQLLIKNASLRLYRIPTSSQLAARVPGPWGPHIRGLIPLPILPPRRPYHSSLLSLTANLPNTPHIDLLAAPPWNLDFAHPCFVANHRIRHNDDRKIWANAIKDLTGKPDHLTIFAQGSKANHNCDDNQMPATCIAVSFSNHTEIEHSSRTLGTSATAFDADLRSLVSAAHLAQNHLNRSPTKQITILSPSPLAIQAISNLRPHAGQFHSREFCSTLTQIFSVFRNAKVHLDWCPSRPKLVGIKRCIKLALNNAANPLPPNLHEPHTIAFQKATAKELALAAWQARWHNADRHSQVYLALPNPPAGKLPPAIQGAMGGSRHACTTLVRFIAGHAFIGEYYARFHPRKPTGCPECGTDPQTVAHVICHCPRFARARAAHLILIAPDLSLSTLFSSKEGSKALLEFLEVTKACFKPLEEPPDPG